MDAAGEQAVDLREYLAVLRARKWTIILVTLLVVGSAMFFSYQQTPLYTAETRLLVKGLRTGASTYVPPANLETEAEVLASEDVAARVQEDLELATPTDELLEDLSVDPVAETAEVLEISYTSPIAEEARDVSDAFARFYIETRNENAVELYRAGQAALEQRVTSARRRMAELTAEVEEAREDEDQPLINTLETERGIMIARLGVLQQRLDDYQVNRPIEQGGSEIIQPARVPTSPSSPSYIRNALLAVFLGLALGVGLAFLRERLDDRFKGRFDVTRVLRVPVLAAVPQMKKKRKNPYPLAMAADTRGAASEAYRGLRTSVEFLGADRNLKSFLITSSSPGEGKTVTAVNLAVSLAQAGREVILVSSDLRRPTLEKYFGLQQTPGLSDWFLSDSESLFPLLQTGEIPKLKVLGSGGIPANPAELLASPRLSQLVAQLEELSDIVIFDSPPVLAVADPLILASNVAATLIIVDIEKTHRSAAEHSKDELERVGATVIGSVLNSFDPSGSPYYYEPYAYRYTPAASGGNGGGAERKKPRSRLGFRR